MQVIKISFKLYIVRGQVDRLNRKMILDRKVQEKEVKIWSFPTSGYLLGHPKKLQAYRLKSAMSKDEGITTHG